MSSSDGGGYAIKKPDAEQMGIIQDPNHVEYLGWSDRAVFDPEVFDFEEVNRRLTRLR